MKENKEISLYEALENRIEEMHLRKLFLIVITTFLSGPCIAGFISMVIFYKCTHNHQATENIIMTGLFGFMFYATIELIIIVIIGSIITLKYPLKDKENNNHPK